MKTIRLAVHSLPNKEPEMNLSEMMAQENMTPVAPQPVPVQAKTPLQEVMEKQKAGELPWQQPSIKVDGSSNVVVQRGDNNVATSPLSAMLAARASQPSEQAQAALAATAPQKNLEDHFEEFKAAPITPPDMPEATPVAPWDPDTQSAIMDQVVGTVEEPVKKKRGRPKKEQPATTTVLSRTEADTVVKEVLGAPLPGQTTLPMMNGTPVITYDPAQTVVVKIESSSAGAPAVVEQPRLDMTPKPKVQAVKGFTMYLNAIPTKGDRRDIMLAEDFTAPLMQEIALENGVSDARQIKFEWQNLLTARVLTEARAGRLPAALIICGYGKEQDALLALTPYAEFIVKGV